MAVPFNTLSRYALCAPSIAEGTGAACSASQDAGSCLGLDFHECRYRQGLYDVTISDGRLSASQATP